MKKEFSNILDYSNYFKKLVEFERKEEQARHLKEIQKFSGEKREQFGRAFLGLKAKYQGRGLGNTLNVKFGRETVFGEHEFSIGDLIIATPKSKPTGKEQTGTITEITTRSITVSYIDSTPNNLFKAQQLRVDLYTNDVSYARMNTALSRVKSHSSLKRILLGKPFIRDGDKVSGDGVPEKDVSLENKNLNSTQKDAVFQSLNYKDIFFLHGPPGTGKTTTLVESILHHKKKGNKILVCADSNIAVDTLMEKLLHYSTSVVRIGNTVKAIPEVLENTLDYKLQSHHYFKDAQSLYRQVDEIRKKQQETQYPSQDLKRGLSDAQIKNYARTKRTTRGIPIALMRKMGAWLSHQERISELTHKAKILEKLSIEEILNSTSIVVSTNVNAGSQLLEEYLSVTKTSFDVCFIDEATQSVEPSTLIPALLAPKLILAGDHLQLPPTVLSQNAQGLRYSMFERLLDIYNYQHYLQLTVQYRMNKDIMKFSNEEFYSNSLIADNSVANTLLKPLNAFSKQVVEIVECSGVEDQFRESTSYYNKEEAQKVISFIEQLLLPPYSLTPEQIGVISPYLAQVQYIRKNCQENIEIKSIDGFQGREKEVIIVSFVRSNSNGSLGFLEDYRRLNVALTRAKKKLILIGNWKTLKCSNQYYKLYNLFSK